VWYTASICVPRNCRDMLRARPYAHQYTEVHHEGILSHLRKVIHIKLYIHREGGVWTIRLRVEEIRTRKWYCHELY
jgi:hypothetical protein